MRPPFGTLVIGCACFAGLVGCGTDETEPTSVQLPSVRVTAIPATLNALQGWDRELLALGQQIEGFGGWYFDPVTQTKVVYLTDPKTASAAVSLLNSELLRVHGNAESAKRVARAGTRVRLAKYRIQDLLSWRVAARALLSNPDVLTLDFDDQSNRVRIDVRGDATEQWAKHRLSKLGVPSDAVQIGRSEGWFFQAKLTDRVRPTLGGLQTLFRIGSGSFSCTLSFNAYRNAIRGFVINSHCSDVQGALDNETFYQNSFTSSNILGTESVDPPFWTGTRNGLTCPAGRTCRNSDALWASYNSTTTSANEVARTTVIGSGGTPGSLTIGSRIPVSTAGVESIFPFCCGNLYKTGASSGTTSGPVNIVCYDANINGTNKTLLCQSAVLAGSAAGDSGSPVYAPPTVPGGTATLYGILWGGNCLSGLCSQYGFSDGSDLSQDMPGLALQ